MNFLRTIVLSFGMLLPASAADIVVLQTGTALRIPNSKIEIRLEDSGKLTVKTQDIRSDWVSREKTVDVAAISEIKEKLALINWSKVAKYKTSGLDGTSVNIYRDGEKFPLWTPHHDSKKRGLVEVQQAIEYLYNLADLTKDGMPLKTP